MPDVRMRSVTASARVSESWGRKNFAFATICFLNARPSA